MTLFRWLTAWTDRLRSSRSAGARGEQAAVEHLRRQGYRILGRNLRNRFGEIDVLAEAPDRRSLVIVEVKAAELDDPTTRGPGAARPEDHVNRAKQRKLAALAQQLLRRYRLTDRPVRFDVIAVDLHPDQPPTVRHHIAAFESPW
ncbi:MAG: YraN family protein [Phycisphaeraceae bacterium]